MANHTSRIQNEFGASVSIEFEIRVVVDALNGKLYGRPNRGEYNRRALVLLVKRLQSFSDAWSENPESFFATPTDENPGRLSELVWKKAEPIQRLLRRYRAMPSLQFAVALSSNGKPKSYRWGVSWIRMDSMVDPWGHHLQLRELMIALDALRIAQAGRIRSLKQCEQCHKWLFAKFSHQRFCSQQCKDEFHKFNEADKKRRRDWAKANYQTRKELELGSRKAAQRKGGKR